MDFFKLLHRNALFSSPINQPVRIHQNNYGLIIGKLTFIFLRTSAGSRTKILDLGTDSDSDPKFSH